MDKKQRIFLMDALQNILCFFYVRLEELTGVHTILRKQTKIGVLFSTICLCLLVPGLICAQENTPEVKVIDRGFIIDKEHKEGPRKVSGVPVEQVDSNYAYKWDFHKTAKTWVYANAWVGDVEAWVKGTFYVDFIITGLPEGFSFIAPQVRAKIKCFGLVDSFGTGEADTNYKIQIISGIKDSADYDWSNALRKSTIFADTDKETWKSWDFVANMTTAAAGAAIGEIPVVGDALDVVWEVASTAWDTIDCDTKIAKRGWVRFINVPVQAGKRYRIFLSNETHVKAVGLGTGSRSIKIDFYKKAPFFTKATKDLTDWGFGIEDVDVVIPQSVYDYLQQQAEVSTQQPEVIQQEAKPDLYFPQLPKIYPSSQITQQDLPELEIFVGTKYKRAKNVKVKVEIPEINWQGFLTFTSLQPDKTHSSKITLPKLSLPGGMNSKGYRINLTIDPDSKIDETTKANNSGFVYIEVIPQRYQLEAHNLSIIPVLTQYHEGSSVTLKGVIKNDSNTDLNNVKVKFYYNAKDQNNPDLKEIATMAVSLKRGERKTVSSPWTVRKSESYYTDVYFIVDPENKIKEQDESQNIHKAQRGIRVRKREITEQPVGGSLKQGVDLAVDDSDVFLTGPNLIGSDYLGVWVKNLGNQKADAYLQFIGYWIETDAQGNRNIKTAILGNLSGNIDGGKSKLFKFYYKSTPEKGFIFSKNIKIVIEARNPQDRDISNNIAIFKIGDFDGIARQIKEEKQREQEQFSQKPDLAIIDIRNIEPPLKIGRERTFQIIIKNPSNMDIKEANINCIIRPKGSGRPHPELGGRSYKKHVAPINAGVQTAVYIDYTPVRKGIYEIVASVDSIKWKRLWEKDANSSNNSLLKYFGVEKEVSQQAEQISYGKGVDLAVEDIWIDNKTPNVGEVITGGFVVRNNSATKVKDAEWAVYSGNHKIAEGIISEIAPHSSYTVTASSQADKQGTFLVRAVVDPDNKIKEQDETNNYKEIKLGIEEESLVNLPQVDLAVDSIKLTRSNIKAGETTKAIARISNLGKDTAYAVPINFQINDKTFFVQVIDELKSGEIKEISAPIVGILGGSYKVKVIVDKKNLIKELNEDNNIKSTLLRVQSPLKPPHLRNLFFQR